MSLSKPFLSVSLFFSYWACGLAVMTPPSHGGGRRFESCRAHEDYECNYLGGKVSVVLLRGFETMYWALVSSAQDPVVVPNKGYDPEQDWFLGFDASDVFFYTEDDGERIIRRRIKDADADMRRAYARHKEMNGLFERARRKMEGGETGVAQSIVSLCDLVVGYGEFVSEHRKRLGRAAFFKYPYYMGHGFFYAAKKTQRLSVRYRTENVIHVDVQEKVLESSVYELAQLNVKKTKRGLEEEMRALKRFAGYGSDWNGNYGRISFGGSTGMYQEALDSTKMLLREHFDFDVEQG